MNKKSVMVLAVTSIPRLCASLIRSLTSFMASWPQLRMPADEYLIIGEK